MIIGNGPYTSAQDDYITRMENVAQSEPLSRIYREYYSSVMELRGEFSQNKFEIFREKFEAISSQDPMYALTLAGLLHGESSLHDVSSVETEASFDLDALHGDSSLQSVSSEPEIYLAEVNPALMAEVKKLEISAFNSILDEPKTYLDSQETIDLFYQYSFNRALVGDFNPSDLNETYAAAVESMIEWGFYPSPTCRDAMRDLSSKPKPGNFFSQRLLKALAGCPDFTVTVFELNPN